LQESLGGGSVPLTLVGGAWVIDGVNAYAGTSILTVTATDEDGWGQS